MSSFVISPVTDFVQYSELSRSGSISSLWARSHNTGHLKRQTTLGSWFRTPHQSHVTDVQQRGSMADEVLSHNYSQLTFADSLAVMSEMESYLGNQTPKSKIKQPSSALQSFREMIREHTIRLNKSRPGVRRRGSLRLRRHHRHLHHRKDRRFRLFKCKKKKIIEVEEPYDPQVVNNGDQMSIVSSIDVEQSYEEARMQNSVDVDTDIHCLSPVGNDSASNVGSEGEELFEQATHYSPVHELPFETLDLLKKKMFVFPDLSFFGESDEDPNESQELDLESDEATVITFKEKINHCKTNGSVPGSSSPSPSPQTPECVRDLFVEAPNSHDSDEARLSSIGSTESSHSSVLELLPANITEASHPNWGALQRAISYFERVKSAVVGEQDQTLFPMQIIDIETLSTDSNYTPVPVTVPTLRRLSFLGELVDTISDGALIEPMYKPETTSTNLVACEAVDENVELSFMNSAFFEPLSSDKSICAGSAYPWGTIRFDTFSNVLFYNKDSSIRGGKRQQGFNNVATSTIIGQSFNFRKKAGDVVSEQLNKSHSSKRLGFSKLTRRTIHDYRSSSTQLKPSILPSSSSPSQNKENEPKSILRSRHNHNIQQESLRLAACDNVDIHAFMTLFDSSEQERFESAPLLDGIREQQLHTYYRDVDEQSCKQLELLDSSL